MELNKIYQCDVLEGLKQFDISEKYIQMAEAKLADIK